MLVDGISPGGGRVKCDGKSGINDTRRMAAGEGILDFPLKQLQKEMGIFLTEMFSFFCLHSLPDEMQVN